MSSLSGIKPTLRPKVMDVFKDELGFDVSGWGRAQIQNIAMSIRLMPVIAPLLILIGLGLRKNGEP